MKVPQIDTQRRILQLDGLRAVAFFIVVCEHLSILPFGWMGVDIFFVLSGFLVTSILRRRVGRENVLGQFYYNRVRRILPAYIICLAFCTIFFPVDWHSAWPFFTFPLENIATSYHYKVGPLGPLWSLAVEEQFYFFWPLLVLRLSRRSLIKVLAVILVLSPFIRAACTPLFSDYWKIYELTPFRVDSICAGALISLLVEQGDWVYRLKKMAKPLLCLAILCLSILSIAGYHRTDNSIIYNALGYSLTYLAGAGILLWSLTSNGGPLYSLLMLRPLRFIGTISYCAYLIHYPMMTLFQQVGAQHMIHRGKLLALLSIPVTLLFASISWFSIEKPILYYKKRSIEVRSMDMSSKV